jgi:hypothetical protein
MSTSRYILKEEAQLHSQQVGQSILHVEALNVQMTKLTTEEQSQNTEMKKEREVEQLTMKLSTSQKALHYTEQEKGRKYIYTLTEEIAVMPTAAQQQREDGGLIKALEKTVREKEGEVKRLTLKLDKFQKALHDTVEQLEASEKQLKKMAISLVVCSAQRACVGNHFNAWKQRNLRPEILSQLQSRINLKLKRRRFQGWQYYIKVQRERLRRQLQLLISNVKTMKVKQHFQFCSPFRARELKHMPSDSILSCGSLVL